MKNISPAVTKFVRWVVVTILTFIVAIPTIVSLITFE